MNKANLYHEVIQILSQLIGLNSTGNQEDLKLKSILVNLTELRDSNLQPIQTQPAVQQSPLASIKQLQGYSDPRTAQQLQALGGVQNA